MIKLTIEFVFSQFVWTKMYVIYQWILLHVQLPQDSRSAGTIMLTERNVHHSYLTDAAAMEITSSLKWSAWPLVKDNENKEMKQLQFVFYSLKLSKSKMLSFFWTQYILWQGGVWALLSIPFSSPTDQIQVDQKLSLIKTISLFQVHMH